MLKDWLCLQGKKVLLCENCRSLPLSSSAGWVTPVWGFSPKRSLLNPVWVYFYHCVDIPQNGADSQTSSWINPADSLCGGLLWSTLVLWAAPWRKEKCWERDWFFPRGKSLSTSKWDVAYVIQLKDTKILCVPKCAWILVPDPGILGEIGTSQVKPHSCFNSDRYQWNKEQEWFQRNRCKGASYTLRIQNSQKT